MSRELLTVFSPEIEEPCPMPACNLGTPTYTCPVYSEDPGAATTVRAGDDGPTKRNPAPGETPGLHGTSNVLATRQGQAHASWSCSGKVRRTAVGCIADRRAYGYWKLAILPSLLAVFLSSLLSAG